MLRPQVSSSLRSFHRLIKQAKHCFFFAEDCTAPQAVAVYCYPSLFCAVKDDIATASEFDINVRVSFFFLSGCESGSLVCILFFFFLFCIGIDL